MVELYYPLPANPPKEAALRAQVAPFGGDLTFREDDKAICLTFEFPSWERAEQAAQLLRQQGEHVEGPAEYADG